LRYHPAARTLTLLAACLMLGAHGHGWMASPISKNELAYHHYNWQMGEETDFHYEPQTSNHGNGIGNVGVGHGFSCGASNESYVEGLGLWQSWYDAAGVDVPRLVPGTDLPVNVTLTIDHGGQAWLMIACADQIAEGNNWTVLERSVSDRSAHFMPSSPGAFAWAPLEYEDKYGMQMFTSWTVPKDFSCPSGRGVARWLWKTANSCNDFNNVARRTEKFVEKEFAAVLAAYRPNMRPLQACTSAPETFISCMDFVIGDHPTPPPAPPTPTPPPAPASCGAAWAQCVPAGKTGPGPTCFQGTCTCTGSSPSYQQCTPAKGKWKC